MTKADLLKLIQQHKTYLSIGLDSDLEKIPGHLKSKVDPQFYFNKGIVDLTNDVCVAYKINTAFYEAQGNKGWRSLEKTAGYIREKYPEHLLIADAKRGDIGNTARMYAETFFSRLNFDAVTLSPYMGKDSIEPFLEYKDKWTILLGLTSNSGATDFQMLETTKNNRYLFEEVIETASKWGTPENMMFVAGATQTGYLQKIRDIVPDHFLLVPGVGAQGGNLEEISRIGLTSEGGLLVNASRSIIFSDNSKNFDVAARDQAIKLNRQMERLLTEKKVT
ncbi:MAG: orotidine-5'-phosphate decarboxylase [Bacteroidales bacterium]|nr:orotidine-5'-phosphate decarboxylase [Bacteroidales bacterium]